MNRRDFLLAATAAAGGTAASGAAAAQQGNASGSNTTGGGNATGGNQSAGGNQSSANATGGNATGGNATGGNATGGNATGGNATGNATGGNQSAGGGGGPTKTVEVGAGSGTSFAPEEVTIAPGGTVVWEWTGEGGAHNVVAEDGAFDSGSPEEGSGITFEHTFQETGEFPYYCAPHEAVGMVGTVIVQEGGASSGGGGGEEEPHPEEMGVPFQAHFVGIATILMMVVSLIYTFFTVKYGESPNAKGGNN